MSQFPPLSFSGLNDWKPYEGTGVGLLPAEGVYKTKITSATPEMNKRGDKGQVKVEVVVQDQDALGTPLITRTIYHGVDTNGNNMNRQFAELLAATGTPVESINQFGAANQAMTIEDACAQLIGKEGYAECEFSINPKSGEPQSQIKNWVAPTRYQTLYENAGNKSPRSMSFEQWSKSRPAAGGSAATATVGGIGLAGPSLGGPAAPAPMLGGPAPVGGVPGPAPAVSAPQLGGAPNGMGQPVAAAPAVAPVAAPVGVPTGVPTL